MKQYTILDNDNNAIGHLQVDENVSTEYLASTYPNLIEGYEPLPYSVSDQDQSRRIRDQLLAAIDQITPVWYASLTPEQQQELQAYRLALLAVPQQAGFPTAIEWPAKPQWL